MLRVGTERVALRVTDVVGWVLLRAVARRVRHALRDAVAERVVLVGRAATVFTRHRQFVLQIPLYL